MNKKEAIRRIKDYTDLKENWNSYNSKPIQINSMANSIKFIENLPNNIVEDMFSVPTSDGGVVLLWDEEDLEIKFCDNKIELFLNEEDISMDRAMFMLDIFLRKEKTS